MKNKQLNRGFTPTPISKNSCSTAEKMSGIYTDKSQQKRRHEIGVSLQSKQGFTLIETLIAITVLLIAIAAPITIIGEALNTTFLARDQMIATHLAGEAFEIVRQTRDTNILDGEDWDEDLGSGDCALGGGNGCTVSVIDEDGDLNISIEKCTGGCDAADSKISKHNVSGLYGFDEDGTWGTPTRFSRWVETAKIGNEHLKVIVTVAWQTSSQSRTLMFESLISERPTL